MAHALRLVKPIVSSGKQLQTREFSIVLGFNLLSDTQNAISLTRSAKGVEKIARSGSDEVCKYCAVSNMDGHQVSGKDSLNTNSTRRLI